MVRVSDSWERRAEDLLCMVDDYIFFLWTCDDRRRCAFLTRRDRKRHNCNVSSSSAHLIKLRQLFIEFFRRLTQTNRQWPWRLKQTAQMQFCMRFSAIFAVFYFSMSVSRHDVTFSINKRSIVENEARQNGKIFTRAISWREIQRNFHSSSVRYPWLISKLASSRETMQNLWLAWLNAHVTLTSPSPAFDLNRLTENWFTFSYCMNSKNAHHKLVECERHKKWSEVATHISEVS